jgi:hypothetical protein
VGREWRAGSTSIGSLATSLALAASPKKIKMYEVHEEIPGNQAKK